VKFAARLTYIQRGSNEAGEIYEKSSKKEQEESGHGVF
jgi:hypothetical protein